MFVYYIYLDNFNLIFNMCSFTVVTLLVVTFTWLRSSTVAVNSAKHGNKIEPYFRVIPLFGFLRAVLKVLRKHQQGETPCIINAEGKLVFQITNAHRTRSLPATYS